MSANLEVIGRERNEVGIVGIEHSVAAQVNQLDKVLFPRFGPPIGTYIWDDILIYRE